MWGWILRVEKDLAGEGVVIMWMVQFCHAETCMQVDVQEQCLGHTGAENVPDLLQRSCPIHPRIIPIYMIQQNTMRLTKKCTLTHTANQSDMSYISPPKPPLPK